MGTRFNVKYQTRAALPLYLAFHLFCIITSYALGTLKFFPRN